jgi:transcriptional regulator with XRE-family HTH domain
MFAPKIVPLALYQRWGGVGNVCRKNAEVTAPTEQALKFGQRIRQLRNQKRRGQPALAALVGVNFTYISKIENEKLDFGDYPSEELILRLAGARDADADELLILARKIPEPIRERVLQRPEAFRRLTALDDVALDRVLSALDRAAIGK